MLPGGVRYCETGIQGVREWDEEEKNPACHSMDTSLKVATVLRDLLCPTS
jgi:hypothetical protein